MFSNHSSLLTLARLSKQVFKQGFAKRLVFVVVVCIVSHMSAYAQKSQKSQKSQEKYTTKPAVIQYSMDVATLTVSGITNTASTQDAISANGLGQLTGNINGKFGGTQGMQPGRWLDVTLALPANSVKKDDDLSAKQFIPKGQRMGQSLQLIEMVVPALTSQNLRQAKQVLRGPDADDKSVNLSQPNNDTDTLDSNAPKKLLLYWGCSDRVRSGQPRQLDMITANNMSVKAVNLSAKSVLKGRAVAEPSLVQIDPDKEIAIWPNSNSRTVVPKEASLVGRHALSGDYIPTDMQFDLKAKQDFMPALAINVNGIKGSATSLNWSRIATAQGYFLMATAKTHREMIIWTSSELPEPGWGLMNYVSNENLAQWKRNKVVLAPSQVSCSIPAGIFNQSNGAMLNGIAYGEESNINNRNANWNVRIRVKSTTMQPFDEFNAAQLIASPNAPTTLINTSRLNPQPGIPGLEETLNRLLTEVPVKKPPECHPCVKPGML